VLDSLRAHAVPIHIVYLGKADDLPRQTSSDFLQITRASEGQIHTARTIEELQAALKSAILPASAAETSAPAKLETVSTVAAPVFKPATVQGRVTFYGKPAKNVSVVLKNDTLERSVRTDADGLFTITEVPAGGYSLASSVVIKNRLRDNQRTVTVPVNSPSPVDLSIELK
jgi:hypothetical protein